ncbi:DUF2306 domain-containing protein [Kitasatospora sp. NBC_00240]|uniref:DUF2306 domain-containing protein n=1 Tax=Kitasatospora sp. NBC_00240 TaxID=2903567 RepID=UPI00225B8830|nr:DUF2306 domain-containing protein [Kitasatospora sp. NBC_00240]MCX5215100.1 DUF2306 domain-containing protein [Kitasatospora sp. NBC_00240]
MNPAMNSPAASADVPADPRRHGPPVAGGLRRAGWIAITASATAIGLLSARYFTLDPDSFLPEQRVTYLADLAPLMLHVGGGVVALVLGPWQFPQRLRTRRPVVHRLIGRVYLVSALATAAGGLLLVPKGLFGPIAPLGFAALAVLLLVATVAAFVSIRRGAVARHQIWMIRSYALIFTGVTFRLWISGFAAAGVPFGQAYGSGAWASWLLNLLVAEHVVARLRTGHRAAGPVQGDTAAGGPASGMTTSDFAASGVTASDGTASGVGVSGDAVRDDGSGGTDRR